MLPMRYQSQLDARSNGLVNPMWISAGGTQAEWDVASASYAPFADIDFGSLDQQAMSQIITATQQLFTGQITNEAFAVIVDGMVEGNVTVTPLTPGGSQEVIDSQVGPVYEAVVAPTIWRFNGGSDEAWGVASRAGLTEEMFQVMSSADRGTVVNYAVALLEGTISDANLLEDAIEGGVINAQATAGSTFEQEVQNNVDNAFLNIFGPMEFHNSLMYNFVYLLSAGLIENNFIVSQAQIEEAMNYFKVLGFSNYDSELMSDIFTAVVNNERALLESSMDEYLMDDSLLCNDSNVAVAGMHLGADAEENLRSFCNLAPDDRLNSFEMGNNSLANVLGVSEGALNQFMIESFGMNLAESMNVNLQQAEESADIANIVNVAVTESVKDAKAGKSQESLTTSLRQPRNVMQTYSSTRRSMNASSALAGSVVVGASLFGLFKLLQSK